MKRLQKLGFFIMLLSVVLPLYAFGTSQEAFNYLKKQQTASIEKSLTQKEKELLKEIQAAKTEDINTLLQEKKERILKLAQKVQNGFKESKSPFYTHLLAFIKKYKKTCIGFSLLIILRISPLQEFLIFQGEKITGDESIEIINNIEQGYDFVSEQYSQLSLAIKPYKTKDGTILYGSYVKHLGETHAQDRKVIFFCHGNAGHSFTRHDIGCNIATQTGCDLFIGTYPGYGVNEGKITSPEKFYEAVECGFKYLTSKDGLGYKEENTILLGFSLGSGATIHIAAQPECNPAALCLASPLLSIPDYLSVIKPITPLFLRYTINNREKIKKVRCPILITHNKNDPIVPFSHGEQLYKMADAQNSRRPENEQKTIKFIHNTDGGHYINQRFIGEMSTLIQSLPS